MANRFPAAMITRKIDPALAAGCTVVCTAPGETPFTSLALAELARAGIPPGVVTIVTTLANTVQFGEVFITHPMIRKISFTGSTGVGKLLMTQASATLKRISMELGGNALFIVFNDAKIDEAVFGAIINKFHSSGQTCVYANRIYIQRHIYDEFTRKFAERVKAFKIGQGFQADVTHGPLINEKAVSKTKSYVEDAESKGARGILGGKTIPELGGNFSQPTVITGMTKDMAIATEEAFDPIAALFPFESEKEVVELTNTSEVGLAGYFFSRDIERIRRVSETLEVGMVEIDTGIISGVALPFGGVKESGFGLKSLCQGWHKFLWARCKQ